MVTFGSAQRQESKYWQLLVREHVCGTEGLWFNGSFGSFHYLVNRRTGWNDWSRYWSIGGNRKQTKRRSPNSESRHSRLIFKQIARTDQSAELLAFLLTQNNVWRWVWALEIHATTASGLWHRIREGRTTARFRNRYFFSNDKKKTDGTAEKLSDAGHCHLVWDFEDVCCY